MVYVDDLDINSYAELFYMPGQFNSFHTESNLINPYHGPKPDDVLFHHPLDDVNGAWGELEQKVKSGLESNPEWINKATQANETFPNQLPFTHYTQRPGNMPNLEMFGANASYNGGFMSFTQWDGMRYGLAAIVIAFILLFFMV